MLDAVPDAVLQVALQHHLARLVQGGFGGVDLGQHVLAGHILVHHAVDGLDLADDLAQAAVEVVGIHTLSHRGSPRIKSYVYTTTWTQKSQNTPGALPPEYNLGYSVVISVLVSVLVSASVSSSVSSTAVRLSTVMENREPISLEGMR